MLSYRLDPKEAPRIRVGTINLEDPITVANLFGLPKTEVQNHQLCGHIAIEVDYRIITPRMSS